MLCASNGQELTLGVQVPEWDSDKNVSAKHGTRVAQGSNFIYRRFPVLPSKVS